MPHVVRCSHFFFFLVLRMCVFVRSRSLRTASYYLHRQLIPPQCTALFFFFLLLLCVCVVVVSHGCKTKDA